MFEMLTNESKQLQLYLIPVIVIVCIIPLIIFMVS